MSCRRIANIGDPGLARQPISSPNVLPVHARHGVFILTNMPSARNHQRSPFLRCGQLRHSRVSPWIASEALVTSASVKVILFDVQSTCCIKSPLVDATTPHPLGNSIPCFSAAQSVNASHQCSTKRVAVERVRGLASSVFLSRVSEHGCRSRGSTSRSSLSSCTHQ